MLSVIESGEIVELHPKRVLIMTAIRTKQRVNTKYDSKIENKIVKAKYYDLTVSTIVTALISDPACVLPCFNTLKTNAFINYI